jgi:hypothetical protein
METLQVSRSLDRKSILKRKGIALVLAFLIAAAIVFTVLHFFYILDSYYYTVEFHVLFMSNNLSQANTARFVEYFSSIGSPFRAAPSLFLAHLVQNTWRIFTKPILPTVAMSALGGVPGAAATFAVTLLIGMLFCGLGVFFLGDIMTSVRGTMEKEQAFRSRTVQTLLSIGLALPYVSILVGGFLGGFFRIPFKRMVIILACGLAFRMGLSVIITGL